MVRFAKGRDLVRQIKRLVPVRDPFSPEGENGSRARVRVTGCAWVHRCAGPACRKACQAASEIGARELLLETLKSMRARLVAVSGDVREVNPEMREA